MKGRETKRGVYNTHNNGLKDERSKCVFLPVFAASFLLSRRCSVVWFVSSFDATAPNYIFEISFTTSAQYFSDWISTEERTICKLQIHKILYIKARISKKAKF